MVPWSTAARVLESCSYRNVLARGFAVVRDQAGLILTRAAATTTGQCVEIAFHDSRRTAVMDRERFAPKVKMKQKKAKKKPPSPSGNDDQGALL